MRYQLVLMIFWLWDAVCSQKDEVTPSSPPDQTTHHLCHEGIQLESASTHTMRINCGEKKNVEVYCDHSESTANCMISYGNEYYIIDWEKHKSTLIKCECDESTSEPGTTSEVNINLCNNSTPVVALGALVGLLLVLLAVVTAGWVWTYWSTRDRRMNPEQTRNDITENHSCYIQPIPAIYESISSNPRREVGKQGENSYDVLNREQLGTIMDPEMTHKEAKMINYSKLELADNELKPEKNPAYAIITQNDT